MNNSTSTRSRVGLLQLAALLLASSLSAEPAIKDGSILGWWRFDNSQNYLQDSSGYGSAMNAFSSGAAGTASGGWKNGCLDLSSKGKTVTAKLGSAAPAYNGTTSPYYTFATRFKSRGTILSGVSALFVDSEVKSVVNDTASWHFCCAALSAGQNHRLKLCLHGGA